MPIDYSKYPKNWKQIVKEIKERANNRCECNGECGLHHKRRCVELNNKKAIYANGKVVLTVAHLNHNPKDNRRKNLKAMCQRCHLRYDSKHHQHNARITRRKKKAMGDLFE